MPTQTDDSPAPARHAVASWLVPAGLIGLGLVPIVGGMFRIAELAAGPTVTAENARFVRAPVPVVVHIASVTVFTLVGAFQFSRSLRRSYPRVHRAAGRVLVPAGIVGAATGLWMSVAPDLPAHDNRLLMVFRVGFGLGMLASLVAGARAASQHRYGPHGAWMRRGYAIALGAGTQAFTIGAWTAAWGEPTSTARAWLMFTGWTINLAVAEWYNHRAQSNRRTPSAAATNESGATS